MPKFKEIHPKIIESVKMRNNCAQTVYYYFQEHHGHSDEKISNHKVNGGGNAPGNLCGALFAAQELLKEQGKSEKVEELNKLFKDKIGGITCNDIRGNNLAPCIMCKNVAVKITEELLE